MCRMAALKARWAISRKFPETQPNSKKYENQAIIHHIHVYAIKLEKQEVQLP